MVLCLRACAQLALYPLLKSKLILPDDIIIDSKSGASGAGRSAKESNLYCEIAEGINSYRCGTVQYSAAPCRTVQVQCRVF